MSAASGSDDRQQQKAQSFFQYGNDAAAKGSFDYAVQMYREALKLQPDNLVFRQALRGTVRKKFGNDPSKVGRLAGARVQPIRLRVRAAKAKGQWAHVLDVCEEAYVYNPWDVSTTRDASEAATQLGYHQLAQWLLESVLAQANDAEFFRNLAQVYQQNENWQKAIQCWERVKQLDPSDEAAQRQINALSASATIARSGLNEALGKRMARPTTPETFAPDVEEVKQQAMTPEERLLKEIEEQPDRPGPYLQLADTYRSRNKLDEAERILARGLKVLPADTVLQSAYGEVQVSRLQRAIEKQTKLCQERPNDEAAKAKLDQLNNYLNEYEVKEFRRRVTLDPDDLKLQYELGLRLARAGRHDEAIAAFQQARQSTALRGQALHQSGLSFEATGVMKLAERSYLDALKETDPADRDTLNALHYRLGRVAEAQGNTREAEEHYNEVAANDYGYLDVAQRLRNLGT